ncbi:hypothetical protein [Mycobacteroides salmoniphilum]|uniref:Uncharacterized protein n=1 Tax=Mycobacteroides salmoniphilum TaxID=404941 RepID=A0A4V3I109_9MYCO|nr:hypothetical protein [Mycobacteroides salmoniphilum]TEA06291.1 hypothetical protein CCUG60884_01429 [Mycobacteroides salmoniphilum]
MEIGAEWIYRARTYSASERVRILGIEDRKHTTRVDIEYLDGKRAGKQGNVPQSRLHGVWSGVAQFDERMANWERIDGGKLDTVEESAVLDVFQLLIPDNVATYYDAVRHGTSIWDRQAMEELLKHPLTEVLDKVEWFDAGYAIQLSAEGTLLIAEFVCAANSFVVLEHVMSKEAEIRENCKHGRDDAYTLEGKGFSPPEREYELYRKYDRPAHELLRSWCGYRAVSTAERLLAAEAEVQRLDILVTRLISVVRKYEPDNADTYAGEHDDDRIRPEMTRPVVDRPLAPSEIPVIKVPVRQNWRYWS